MTLAALCYALLPMAEVYNTAQPYLGILRCCGQLQEYLCQLGPGTLRELWALAIYLSSRSLYSCHTEVCQSLLRRMSRFSWWLLQACSEHSPARFAFAKHGLTSSP